MLRSHAANRKLQVALLTLKTDFSASEPVFTNQVGDVSSPCTVTGYALTKVGPIRTRRSHLDHLASFHLHQLTEVLLQQAGVGAPLQQAQQIHWEENKKMLTH